MKDINYGYANDKISKAFDQGIPVILIDRKIDSDKYTAYVGADNLEIGSNAGNFIASAAKMTTNVIELKVDDNASPSVERSQGFHEVVDSISNIKVVASINYTSPKEHEEILSRVLDSLKNIRIDYFYAFNDVLAFDSWQISRKKGVNDINFIGASITSVGSASTITVAGELDITSSLFI